IVVKLSDRERGRVAGQRKNFRLGLQGPFAAFVHEKVRRTSLVDSDQQVREPVPAIDVSADHRGDSSRQVDLLCFAKSSLSVSGQNVENGPASGRAREVQMTIGVEVTAGDEVGYLWNRKRAS